MADSVEMADIRGLDIDKTVKGFALTNYVFKNMVTVSNTQSDQVRWYKETAADLTATSPSAVANVSPLATFPTLEVTWTRNNSYVRKYAAEGFISLEDINGSDIDVLARTLLRLTRAVVKQVDARIWNVMTESQSASNINSTTTTSIGGDQWDAAAYAANPVKDILDARRQIEVYDYDSSQAVLFLSPKDHMSIMDWLHASGSTAAAYTQAGAGTGNLAQFLGLKVVVSNNVTADYAAVAIPSTAVTWKSFMDTTARVVEDVGKGSRVVVWEIGEALLTDPRAVTLIIDTQT